MSTSLHTKMRKALAWSALDRVTQQLLQLLVGILLARMLSPADFGLVGIVMVFAALAYVLVDSGFGQALSRVKNITNQHFSTIFYTNLCIAGLLYAVVFFAAPLIANFFNQSALTQLIRVLFVAILFNAAYLVPHTQLCIELNFKQIAKVNFVSTFVSGLAGVLAAYAGWGVWALAMQQVGYQFVRALAFGWVSHWRPTLRYSWHILRVCWQFSVHLLGTGVLNVLFNNLYLFLIGKFFPVKQAGYYAQASKLSDTVNFTFLAVLNNSTYNFFARIHDRKDYMRSVFYNFCQKLSLVSIPFTVVLIVVADPFFAVFLGEKWLLAVPYFRLLCAANLFAPLYLLHTNLLNACGYSKITFRIEICKKALLLLSVVFCLYWGIRAMLFGYVVACYVAMLLAMWQVKNKLLYQWKAQFSAVFPALGIGGLLAVLLWNIQLIIAQPLVLLGVQCAVGFCVYFVLLRTLSRDVFCVFVRFLRQPLTFFG